MRLSQVGWQPNIPPIAAYLPVKTLHSGEEQEAVEAASVVELARPGTPGIPQGLLARETSWVRRCPLDSETESPRTARAPELATRDSGWPSESTAKAHRQLRWIHRCILL